MTSFDSCIRRFGSCRELSSTDITAICCAIWAKGFYDAQEAINTVITLVKNGTKHQKMTASYFMHSCAVAVVTFLPYTTDQRDQSGGLVKQPVKI